MKNNGHVVAMTGDGVNDILPLRKRYVDGSGSEARNGSLSLDGSFCEYPKVVSEGRRVINNIKKYQVILNKTLHCS